MVIYELIFVFLFSLVFVFIFYIGYYIGRKDKMEDLEKLMRILVQEPVEPEQEEDTIPKRTRRSERTRWQPGNLLDPVVPEGEPPRKGG